MTDPIFHCAGFQWDDGNNNKNFRKHKVSDSECEEIFFSEPLIRKGPKQRSEERYYALGRTDSGRYLFIVLTTRANLIRVISARDMTQSERRQYQKHEK